MSNTKRRAVQDRGTVICLVIDGDGGGCRGGGAKSYSFSTRLLIPTGSGIKA